MKAFDKTKARELADKIIDAEAALARYLNQCFPTGARCGVILTMHQKTPTHAEIFGVTPTRYGGEIRVRIDTAKPRSRYRYRSIPVRNVIMDY